MSYQERKERREAQKFFRQHNREYFDAKMWVKLILTGLCLAVVFGLLYAAFVAITNVRFLYILAFIGVLIARALKKVAGTGNTKIGILTIIFYVLSIIFSNVFYALYTYWLSTGLSPFALLFSPYVWRMGLSALLSNNIFAGLCIILGGYYAYQSAIYD